MRNQQHGAVTRPVLEARSLAKHFAGVAALTDASLVLPPATVLALVGENGAGKSTLLKILSGAVQADSGEIFIDGGIVDLSTPSEATSNGIATVYQELSLLPQQSVAENIFLGHYPRRRGFIAWSKAHREAEALLERLGVTISVHTAVGSLSLAERYLVEIAKAVRHNPKILILDEPTAALDPQDAERIFVMMEELRHTGMSMVFVSHRLEELFRCAQDYMVLKDGVTVAAGDMIGATEDDLVEKMLASSLPSSTPVAVHGVEANPTRGATPESATQSVTDVEVMLRVRGLSTEMLSGISFDARKGEVIGIAGLRGSGQTELCRALTGADRLIAGSIELAGARLRSGSPHRAWRHGIGYLPQDRKSQGLFLNMSVAENAAMARLVTGRMRWVRRRHEHRLAAQYRDSLEIKLPADRLDTPVPQLSGGNQQKVVLARCLAAGVRMLVLDEPTRGVSVAAKQQIHALITDLAGAGLCVIVSSSELSELLALSAHVLVLHRGHLATQLRGPQIDEHTIVRFASGAA